jgi:hypothetical protein
MQEFFGPIIYDPNHPLSAGHGFAPFGAGLNSTLCPHGPTDREHRESEQLDTHKQAKVQAEGITLFLLETEAPLRLSDWAHGHASSGSKTRPVVVARM